MNGSPVRSRKWAQAASKRSIPYFFVIGMIFARTSSVVALSDTASRGRTGSSANFSIAGAIPTVDTVTRRRERPKPSGSHSKRTAATVAS